MWGLVMRLFLAASIAIAMLSSAFAAPSTDLVFCSKLPDKTERIACYDAAARIAEAKPQALPKTVSSPAAGSAAAISPAAASTMAKAAVPPIAEPPNRFGGFYVAGGGSYGVASSRQFFVSGTTLPTSGDIAPSGASGVLAFGYNMPVTNHWIIGIEFDARYGEESDTFTRMLPNIPTPFGLNTTMSMQHRYKYNNDMAAHMALRAGYVIDNAMVFAKLGVGAARQRHEFSLFESITFQGFPPIEIALASKDAVWAPSFIGGLGFEYNFGRAFARLYGEVESINSKFFTATSGTNSGFGLSGDLETTWTYRTSVMIGARM